MAHNIQTHSETLDHNPKEGDLGIIIESIGYAAHGSLINSLTKFHFQREAPQGNEILIDILYCGVCHSDIHQVNNDWNNTIYPCVPGHEIIGKVIELGSEAHKYNIGDIVGVGCMIDSCGHCDPCKKGEENYCEGPVGFTSTYNGYMKPNGNEYNTFGGYSTNLVIREDFALSIPKSLDIRSVAPILCAGITTYSPLRHWNIKKGDRVGIVGIGGLGHMGVQIAAAMGAEVTAITHTEQKREDAKRLGANYVLISENKEEMKNHELYFDFILNTIPDSYDVNHYSDLLKRDSTLVAVGLLAPYRKPINNMKIAIHRRSIAGSLIGGIKETQEVLDFCAEHKILPMVEVISMQEINIAFEKMEDEEVRFRYVIDMATLDRTDSQPIL